MRAHTLPATRKILSPLGFDLPKGLPHKEYALCDGRVSVVLDRSGGINMVEYLGTRRSDAVRRGAFFSNGFWRGASFFPEPVLEFQLMLEGRPVPWRFTDLVLAPFAVSARFDLEGKEFGFLLWLRGNAVLVEWRASLPVTVALRVREGFLAQGNDEAAWESPVFEPRLGACRYGLLRPRDPAVRQLESQSHMACAILGPIGKGRHEILPDGRRLVAPVGPRQASRWVIAFGEDYSGTKDLFRAAAGRWETWFAAQARRYGALASTTPCVEGSGVPPPLGDLVRTAPLFVESMRIERNPRQVGLRASTHGYGMWNGWDGQWSALLLNACKSCDTVPRYLEFLDAVRGPNGAIPMRVNHDFGPVEGRNFSSPPADRELGAGYQVMHEMWGIANLHQYVARSGDRAMLRKLWPNFARSLRTICRNASPLGLVESCFGGVDLAEEVGRPVSPDPRDHSALTSRLTGPEDMGVLFHGCVQGAELAAAMGDSETARSCRDLAGRVQASFSSTFLDTGSGFLYDAVWPKDDPVNRNAFPRLTSLLALFGHGELLLLESIEGLARFVRERMCHPEIGLRTVAADSPSTPVYERWKDNWLQNPTRETLKLARLAGDRELLDLQVDALLRNFEADKLIHKNLFHARKGGRYDPARLSTATSWWQGMSAYAWWTGLIESVIGLRVDRGAPEYALGDAGRDVSLSNFHWGGRRWSLSVTGRGKWIGSMRINGRERAGACSFHPFDPRKDQRVVIRKTDRPPAHPVILTAGANAVLATRATRGRLQATVRSTGFTPLHFFSPARPALRVAGKEVPFRWVEARSEGVSFLEGKGDLDLEIG